MRLGFIRKVYGILTAQVLSINFKKSKFYSIKFFLFKLLLTVFICVLAVNSNGFKTFLFSNFMALFMYFFTIKFLNF